MRKFLKKGTVFLTCVSMLMWTMGIGFVNIPTAQAASLSVVVSEPLEFAQADPMAHVVGPSSFPTAIAKFSVWTSQAGAELASTTVIIGGDQFSTSTLLTLGIATTSGVALFRDVADGNDPNFFDEYDQILSLNSAPSWTYIGSSTAYQLTFDNFSSPVTLTQNATTTFFLAIQTSSYAVDGTQITTTVPANSLVTTVGSGPSSQYDGAVFTVDAVGPTVTAVEKISNNTVEVVFSEIIDSMIDKNYFAFNEGLNVVEAMVNGPNVIKVTADGDVYVGSTTLSVTADVVDMAGNANQKTSPTALTLPKRIKISEIASGLGSVNKEFVELYNAGSNSVDISDWRIQRSSAYSGSTWNTIAYIPASTIIQPYGYYLLSTTEFDAVSGIHGDDVLTPGYLTEEGGHIRLYDYAHAKTVDKIGWGTAASPDGTAAPAMTTSASLERKAFGMNTASDLANGGPDEFMGNSWDMDDNGQDFVLQSSPNPQNSASAPEQPDYSGFGTEGPMIFHMPINFAPTGSDLKVYAQMGDPMTSLDQIGARLYYMTGDSLLTDNVLTDYVGVFGTHQANGYFEFIIPSAVVDASTNYGLNYFLEVTNSNGDSNYMSASPDADMSGDISRITQNPFVVQCGNEGTTYNISGTVNLDGASSGDGVLILLEGTGYSATSTSNGTYTITAPRGLYNIIMIKTGYYEEWIGDVYVRDGDVTLGEKTLYLGTGGGMTGDSTKPYVMWTMPYDGDSNMPAGDESFKIVVGLSKEMDVSTFSTSSVILTTGDINQPVSAYNVSYNPDTRESWMPSSETDPYILVVGVPNGGLAPGTTYYLVMTGNIRDTSGNSLTGNRTDGGHEISFSTAFDTAGFDYGTGANMPPFVMNESPGGGSFGVPTNTKIAVKFSESMDSDSVSTSGNIRLYKIDYLNNSEQSTEVSISTTLDTTKKIAVITPQTLLSINQKYRVVVTGALRSDAGIYMGDPSQNQNTSSYEFYRFSFETGASVDNTSPTVLGSWPRDGSTNIEVNPGMFNLQLSETLDPSSVNANTVSLKRGTTLVSTDIRYDSGAHSIYISPKSILANNTQYTITLIGSSTSAIKDMSGNVLASNYVVLFNTNSTTDTTDPEIMFANGDDFGMAITFNEPMKSAKATDLSNWSSSVLNPANYLIKWGDPSGVVLGGSAIDLNNVGAQLMYDSYNNTVLIENLGLDPSLTPGKDFYIDMSTSGASDLAGNLVASSSYSTFQMPINSSSDTYGLLGPGDSVEPEMGDMGMMAAGAFPMNAMAGQQTIYFVDVPTSRSIPSGAKIVITFPSGFDVSGASKDPYSPINNDINEWNDGVVTIASVSSSQTNKTVTITTGGSPTQANDYLHMDIAGIINSSIPRDFETSGYSVNIKTLDASGNLIENIATMPFYITAAGQSSLNVTAAGINGAHVDGTDDYLYIFLGSPMTGPMEKIISLAADGTGSTTFTGLPEGQYNIFTEPVYSLDGTDYAGMPMPEPIWVRPGVNNKTITFTEEGTGSVAAVTVNITGSFGTDDIDVFAGSANSFKVKTIFSAGDNPSATLYLTDGDWRVGMGPAMPKGDLSAPPPMPDWMAPEPIYVNVSSGGSKIYEASDTANDGILEMIVESADKQIIGYVRDDVGEPIADAEVFAYQPMGGSMGSYSKTGTNGKFTLKVGETGNYNVGTYKPGLPFVPERSIVVKTNSGASDDNATADVYRDGGSLVSSSSPFVIKIQKPEHTISGKVTDGTNAVSYAPVWADKSDGTGHVDSMTDASGNFILYVSDGTWSLNSYIPGYGDAEGKIVVVDGADETQNLAPDTTTTYINLRGTVSDGSAMAYLPIRAVQYNDNGVYTGKEYGASTDGSGNYSISVPSDNKYRIDIWTPEYGEVGLDADEVANSPANVIATSTSRSGLDITIDAGSLRSIDLSFANAQSGQEGFLNVEGVSISNGFASPNGFQYHTRIDDLSASNTIKLADGDYFFFVEVPGLGEFIPDAGSRSADDAIAVSADRNVDFTLTDLSSGVVTISGTVYDTTATSGSELADAWIWVGNPGTGYHNGTQSAADGSYSIVVPSGSSYKMGADKPGFMSGDPIDLNAQASSTKNFVLSSYSVNISGYIYKDANANNSLNSGEEVPNGFVRAETIGCQDDDDATICIRSHSPVDGSGYYELGVVNGTWKVYGMADAYQESEYGQNITINGSNAIANIKLSSDDNWTSATKKKPITPASGGSMDDTAPGGTGVKLNIPPNAMGNSSAAGNVNAKKTSSVTETNSMEPVGGKGVNVTATDNSGQAITNLNDYIDMEMVIYKAEIEQAISSGELSYAKLKSSKNGYWDNTTNDWVNLSTTRKAYYKLAGDTDWKMYSETGTSTSAFVAFVNRLAAGSLTSALGSNPVDYKLVFTSKTNHLTVFAIVMPFVVTLVDANPEPEPDPAPDPAPVVVSGTGGGGGGGGVSTPTVSYCTSVEYGLWNPCQNGSTYRDVTAKFPSDCRLTSAQEADKTSTCIMEEMKRSEIEPDVAITLMNINDIDRLYLEQGAFIKRADINEILPVMSVERNHEAEQAAREMLINKMGLDLASLELGQQYGLTNFVAYGSPDTAKIGSGERAGVVNSFRAAFGKLPESDSDWSDVVKIANGRWPATLSEEAENKATDIFEKIYKRIPDRSNPNDDAAVTVIAYGLRPSDRNQESEKAAINSFKGIFGYQPSAATDWDIVRAISYSGAIREADSDKDLLPDAREELLNTDPNNPDTDGDGYTDGEEVRRGFDPLS